MTNEQWLELFKEIGSSMREGLSDILNREGGKIPLGKGAGGDKTYPVDKWAEDIILSALEKAHQSGENFTFISEEMGVRTFGKGGKLVLADPIDGSNNAKSGLPMFATALTLLEGNKLSDLAVAYVTNLSQGDEFWAVRGAGAYHNGTRLRTSEDEDITIVAFEASTPGRDILPLMPVINKARRVRCLGSTALDLAYLASGAVSVFITAMASRTFDFAAGMLIVQEAGGVMTDLAGASLHHVVAGLDRTVPLLASANQRLHAKVLELLTSHKS